MATYAIGDVQGCWQALQRLLDHLQFDPAQDTLWFTGDLVNRGPDSLAVLRFVSTLKNPIVVLGNHDLHFLALFYTQRPTQADDTLNELLASDDCPQLAAWLIQRPLFYHDQLQNYAMVHAGIPPTWTLAQTLHYAQEVEQVLQSDQRKEFFLNMYANQPNSWHESIVGLPRLRLITNYLTRMRFLDHAGHLNLSYKGELDNAPDDLIPWFNYPRSTPFPTRVIFGHWAALRGHCPVAQYSALDGGCVWGYELMALRLEDGQRFAVQ